MSEALPILAAAPAVDREPLRIPPGYGLRVIPAAERADRLSAPDDSGLYDVLLCWEGPRRRCDYVVSVDVSGGMGQDNSVIDVTRIGDLREPDEQVAQYVSSTVDPIDLAYLIAPIGYLYKGTNGLPAYVAIETNFGLGLGTQSELLRHVGYENLFIWQVEDAATPEARYRNSFGWSTNQRTRPIMLQRYFHAIKTIDKHTGYPDYRINSPHTIRELADFVTAGALWDGEAAPGAHDDCIMAGSIGVHIAHTTHFETREPLSEARRRISEERARAGEIEDRLERGVNYQTIDLTADEIDGTATPDDGVLDLLGDTPHYL